MGDDIPDLPVASEVGVFACPSDAVDEILQIAHFNTCKPGGAACVRELIEKVMKLNQSWSEDETIPST